MCVIITSGSFPDVESSEFQGPGAEPDAARSLAPRPELARALSAKAKITIMVGSVINELHKHGMNAWKQVDSNTAVLKPGSSLNKKE